MSLSMIVLIGFPLLFVFIVSTVIHEVPAWLAAAAHIILMR